MAEAVACPLAVSETVVGDKPIKYQAVESDLEEQSLKVATVATIEASGDRIAEIRVLDIKVITTPSNKKISYIEELIETMF